MTDPNADEQHQQLSPADEIDKVRPSVEGRTSEPAEPSNDDASEVGEGLGGMQHGPTADYGDDE